jgi:hypothetical protein
VAAAVGSKDPDEWASRVSRHVGVTTNDAPLAAGRRLAHDRRVAVGR